MTATITTTAPRAVAPYRCLAWLQLLDVSTTWLVLDHWSARAEGNPVAAALLHTLGLEVGLLLLLAVKLTVVWSLYVKQTGIRLVSALYGVVIVNNLLFLVLWAAS